jgi:hypothetical protein
MRPRFGMHVDHNARMAKGPNFESPAPGFSTMNPASTASKRLTSLSVGP